MTSSDSDAATLDNVTDLADVRRSKAAGSTPPGEQAKRNRTIDRDKVERIKAAIADGSYTIDPLRVADKFIEYERN